VGIGGASHRSFGPSIRPYYLGIFLDHLLRIIRDIAADICINVDRFSYMPSNQFLFVKALAALVYDIGELVGSNPFHIIFIWDTLWETSLGLVNMLHGLVQIIMNALILAILCCLDVIVASLRISMCIMDLCFDMIEVLLRRVLNVSPLICSFLHVAFLSLLILLVL
jgi:hypothetical protein